MNKSQKTKLARPKNLTHLRLKFLIPKIRKILMKLKQIFVKSFILNYFDLKHYIYIKQIFLVIK